jgi:hypothetical protein
MLFCEAGRPTSHRSGGRPEKITFHTAAVTGQQGLRANVPHDLPRHPATPVGGDAQPEPRAPQRPQHGLGPRDQGGPVIRALLSVGLDVGLGGQLPGPELVYAAEPYGGRRDDDVLLLRCLGEGTPCVHGECGGVDTG